MFLRNRLWNKLVEIEREHRRQRDALLRTPELDEIETLTANLRELRKRLKAAKTKAPRLKHEDPAQDLGSQIKDLEARLLRIARLGTVIGDGTLDAIADTKAAIRALWLRAKESRRAKATENKPVLDRLELERRAAVKATRVGSGLYWVNHDEVVMNYGEARVRAMKEGAQLQFHRWNGEGKISVRFDRGGEHVFSVDQVDAAAYESESRAERRRACFTNVRLRTYSADGSMINVAFGVYLHRSWQGTIRTASLIREAIAGRARYSLVVTVDAGTPPVREGMAVSVNSRTSDQSRGGRPKTAAPGNSLYRRP